MQGENANRQLWNTIIRNRLRYLVKTEPIIARAFADLAIKQRRASILNESEKQTDRDDIMKQDDHQERNTGEKSKAETPCETSQRIQEEQPTSVFKMPTMLEGDEADLITSTNTSGPLENSPPDHSELGGIKGGERAPYEAIDFDTIQSREGLDAAVNQLLAIRNDPDKRYGWATRHAAEIGLQVYACLYNELTMTEEAMEMGREND